MTARFNYLIFALATIAGVSIRTVMLLFTVDNKSGFIIPEYTVWAVVLIVFLLVSAGVVFFFSMMSSRAGIENDLTDRVFLPLASSLVAAAIIYETYFSPLLKGGISYQVFIHSTLALLSALALLIIALCGIRGMAFPPIIAAVPVFYWLIRLIIIFSSFSTISVISDTLIETAAMCLTLVSFIIYSKLEGGALIKKRYPLYFATVMLTANVCFISSVPRLICEASSVGQAVHLNTIPATTSLAVAVFLIIVSTKIKIASS